MNHLAALYNLTQCEDFQLSTNEEFVPNYVSAEGKPLEVFVKAIFCGIPGQIDSFKNLDDVFVYIGSSNSPPDVMLKNSGDAIEIKKVEKNTGGIILNSSLPKTKLHSNDPMINERAKNCERWTARDMLYVVGHVPPGRVVKSLFFFYGDCFAKENEFYKGRFEAIKEKVSEVEGISSTGNEYGTLKDADGLGNGVNMRVRPINSINSPWKIFSDHVSVDGGAEFSVVSILRKVKYLSFPRSDIEKLEESNVEIEDIAITDPDNPEEEVDAKLISHVLT